ncbi:MAG: 50S ribosomal protein L10 [Candidatus Omnitrophota bacterium]|nr:50S ribosomal protein L10 [Candidatus Omnitrophota bacterium]
MITAEKIGKLCKDKMITELLLRFEKHPNFIITNYMGLSTSDMEMLRGKLKKSSANYFVVKNSILKLVFDKMKLEEESSQIEGGIGISFAGGDVISACNILVGFAKTHDKFKIKGGVIDGKRLATDKISQLASLPPRNVLIAQVVGSIKSPITGFVNTLGGILRKFVYAIDAIKQSRKEK